MVITLSESLYTAHPTVTIDQSSNTSFEQQHFVHAFHLLQGMLKKAILCAEEPLHSSSPDSIFSNTLHFGEFLSEIELMKSDQTLLPMIKLRRQELLAQKEHWRPFVNAMQQGQEMAFYAFCLSIFREATLVPFDGGSGNTYAVCDAHQKPQLVVKTVDGDIFCLNNAKAHGSPFNDAEHRVREDIALYHSPQTDALCSEIASLAGIEEATPKTIMAILNNEQFYDFTTRIPELERQSWILATGFPDPEKLCSVQEFIPNAVSFAELLHEFYAQGLSDEEIAAHFDQQDFEQVCLLLWLSYDNDAHSDNFLVYVKSRDESGKKIYGIKKIDNGLSFPEKNTNYSNILTWAPNARFPISDSLKQKICQLPLQRMLQKMEDYELTCAKEAFLERVDILQQLAQKPGITIGEIDLRLNFLSFEKGKELVLSRLSTMEILAQIQTQDTNLSNNLL